jgi:hypothetical protein
VDPIGFIVVCAALYGILQRTPALIRDLAAEIPQVLRGDGEPFADVRRQKLIDDGVQPTATGGRLRDHLGDLWKYLIHDLGAERRERRNARAPHAGEGWFDRIRGRVAEGVDVKVDDWGGKVIDGELVEPAPRPTDPHGGTSTGDTNPPCDAHPRENQRPVRVPSTLGNPAAEPAAPPAVDEPPARVASTIGESHPPAEPDDDPLGDDQPWTMTGDEAARLRHELFADCDPDTCPGCADERRTTTVAGDDRGPVRVRVRVRVRVPSTVGVPHGALTPADHTRPASTTATLAPTALLELEGPSDMSNAVATTGGQVTGVISGANEALAIYRQLEAATQEYVAQIAAVRRRLNNLGSDTLCLVQFSGTGAVVVRMGQAAEAAAAAEANAQQCSAEVGPLLLATKREFDKRNS